MKKIFTLIFCSIVFFATAVVADEENIDDNIVQNILSSQDVNALEKLIAEGLDVNSRD